MKVKKIIPAYGAVQSVSLEWQACAKLIGRVYRAIGNGVNITGINGNKKLAAYI
jgi:hypothetical protein